MKFRIYDERKFGDTVWKEVSRQSFGAFSSHGFMRAGFEYRVSEKEIPNPCVDCGNDFHSEYEWEKRCVRCLSVYTSKRQQSIVGKKILSVFFGGSDSCSLTIEGGATLRFSPYSSMDGHGESTPSVTLELADEKAEKPSRRKR